MSKFNLKISTLIMFFLACRTVFSMSELTSWIGILSDVSTIALISLCLYRILKLKYSNRELIIYFIIILFSMYTSFILKKMTLLIAVTVFISLKDVDIKKNIAILHNTKLVLVLIHCFLFFVFYIFQKDALDYLVDNRYGIRYFVFFGHPNAIGSLIFGLIVESIYLKFERISIRDYLGIVLIVLIMYVFIHSRTLLLLTLLLGIFLLAYKKCNNFKDFLSKRNVMRCILIIAILISFMTMICSNYNELSQNKLLFSFDKMLSWRLRYSNSAYEKYGISILPQYIDFDNDIVKVASNVFAIVCIDNLYCKFFMNFGLIWLLMYYFILSKSIKNLSSKEIFLFYIMIIYSFMENYIINIGVLPILIIIVDKLINKRKKEE